MDDKELYKLRAEDYARNFESLRTLEWQVVFQMYAGYTLFGATYSAISEKHPGSTTYAWMIIGAIVLLFLSTLYLGIRIQERQNYARKMQNAYLAKLHEVLDVPQVETPPDVKEPKHQGSYAFIVQTILSISFAAGLIIFILKTM